MLLLEFSRAQRLDLTLGNLASFPGLIDLVVRIDWLDVVLVVETTFLAGDFSQCVFIFGFVKAEAGCFSFKIKVFSGL